MTVSQRHPCVAREPISRADPEAEPSAARARLQNLSDNLRVLNAGFALGAVYGEHERPEAALAGDLLSILRPLRSIEPTSAMVEAGAAEIMDCERQDDPMDRLAARRVFRAMAEAGDTTDRPDRTRDDLKSDPTIERTETGR